ncbi:YqzH family protein [Pseudalkalibacillus sp. A8]|uniref:YqzH family protein n=1 Tax=Pseudalkalibacillus sp. A8 TaxID=3382641 RepID=UPI0038B59CAA
MEKKLVKKMIDRCLVDYFGDLEFSPITEVEYDALIDDIVSEVHNQPHEDVFALVHDKIYSYLASSS